MLLDFNFLSHKLGKQTSVSVILPTYSIEDGMSEIENYHKPNVKFQVIYLLHGGFGDHQDYVKFTNIVRYAEENKVAVVMPSGYNSFYHDSNTGIAPAKYWEYVFEELPELMEAYFPISNYKEDKFVAGLSMGGHGTMKMLIHGTDRFAAGLMMSGVFMDMKASLFADIGSLHEKTDELVNENMDFYQMAKDKATEGNLPKLYITCGDQDFLLQAVRKSYGLLKDYGYPVYYKEVEGFGHEWDFWDQSLKEAIYEVLPLERKPLFK